MITLFRVLFRVSEKMLFSITITYGGFKINPEAFVLSIDLFLLIGPHKVICKYPHDICVCVCGWHGLISGWFYRFSPLITVIKN